MIKAVQLVRGDTVEVMAEHRLITISVLDDGTININTPDGAICKIWPSKSPKKIVGCTTGKTRFVNNINQQ